MFMVMENECRHNTSHMESAINYFCIILKRNDWRRIVNKHYFDFFYSKGDSSMAFYLLRLSYSESIHISWELDIDVMSIYHVDRASTRRFVFPRNTVWSRAVTFNLRLKSQYLQWCVRPEKIKIHGENSF